MVIFSKRYDHIFFKRSEYLDRDEFQIVQKDLEEKYFLIVSKNEFENFIFSFLGEIQNFQKSNENPDILSL